jgi:hypothetical protein
LYDLGIWKAREWSVVQSQDHNALAFPNNKSPLPRFERKQNILEKVIGLKSFEIEGVYIVEKIALAG